MPTLTQRPGHPTLARCEGNAAIGDEVVVLPAGGIPPTGSWVFGYSATCGDECVEVGRSGDYWIGRLGAPPG